MAHSGGDAQQEIRGDRALGVGKSWVAAAVTGVEEMDPEGCAESGEPGQSRAWRTRPWEGEVGRRGGSEAAGRGDGKVGKAGSRGGREGTSGGGGQRARLRGHHLPGQSQRGEEKHGAAVLGEAFFVARGRFCFVFSDAGGLTSSYSGRKEGDGPGDQSPGASAISPNLGLFLQKDMVSMRSSSHKTKAAGPAIDREANLSFWGKEWGRHGPGETQTNPTAHLDGALVPAGQI